MIDIEHTLLDDDLYEGFASTRKILREEGGTMQPHEAICAFLTVQVQLQQQLIREVQRLREDLKNGDQKHG